MKKIMLMVLLVFGLSGCGKFDVVNHPAAGISEARQVCIIEDPATKTGFAHAMQDWLVEDGKTYKMLPFAAPNDKCEWAFCATGCYA